MERDADPPAKENMIPGRSAGTTKIARSLSSEQSAFGARLARCRGLSKGPAGWRYRVPPCTPIAGREPSAGGGQFWLVLAGDTQVDGGDLLPANSCIFVGPEEPAFAGASGPVGAELLCLQFRRSAQD
jgi:hypothetical protein